MARLAFSVDVQEPTTNEEYLKQKHRMKSIARRPERLALKVDVLTHYGNGKLVCVGCGYSDLRALSIDHINNNGAEERQRFGGGSRFYQYLKDNNYPEGYQTLCMNCQWVKRETYGRRHHNKKAQKEDRKNISKLSSDFSKLAGRGEAQFRQHLKG
jgi:hypothetical protein